MPLKPHQRDGTGAQMSKPFPKSVPSKYYTYSPDGLMKSENAPLISVIVPIYNAGHYLDQALSSIEDQTYKNLEIICLNDGSTDDSLDIMGRHAEKDSRIVLIDKENEGYGSTCNRGIDEAHGEWISILEPDDWLEPTMYEDMIEHASRFACKADIIKSPYWRIEDPDTPQQRKLHCSYARRMKGIKQPFTINDAVCLIRHHPSIWSAIYRKSFLDENCIRFPPIPGAGWADNPFLIDTLCRAKNILYVDKAYYCYRNGTEEQEKAFSANNPSVPINRWLEMTDIIEEIGIDDPQVLKSHYSHGFLYTGGILESHSPDEPEIHDMLVSVYKRMKPELVFEDDSISPASKRLYAELLGIEPQNTGRAKHAAYLANQAMYNILNVGPREFGHTVRRYVTKYRKRSGGR